MFQNQKYSLTMSLAIRINKLEVAKYLLFIDLSVDINVTETSYLGLKRNIWIYKIGQTIFASMKSGSDGCGKTLETQRRRTIYSPSECDHKQV